MLALLSAIPVLLLPFSMPELVLPLEIPGAATYEGVLRKLPPELSASTLFK